VLVMLELESLSCIFIQAKTFSMAFRSELFPGYMISLMCGLS
jgi:hypothetical protein